MTDPPAQLTIIGGRAWYLVGNHGGLYRVAIVAGGRCVKVVIVGELRGSVWSIAYYISFSYVFYLAPLSVNIFR